MSDRGAISAPAQKTITDEQIAQLRAIAALHGDCVLYRLASHALGWESDIKRPRSMTQAEARMECEAILQKS